MRVESVVTPREAHCSEVILRASARVAAGSCSRNSSQVMTAISWLPTQPIAGMSSPMSVTMHGFLNRGSEYPGRKSSRIFMSLGS